MRHVGALVLGLVLAQAGVALASCESVGSQVDCRWPGVAMRFGTQTDPTAQTQSSALRMQGFAGPMRLGREVPQRGTLTLSVQSFSDDARACQRYGNETYCY
jgi:hypothetical protein